jgi:uncharacterized protein (DUF362 family)
LEAVGGLSKRVFPGARVLIKPNFVAPFPRATTDLSFVEFHVAAVRELGGIPVLGESSGFEFDTRATFRVLGVEEFARKHNVPLIDFEEAAYRTVDLGQGVGKVALAEAALHADFIINLPVLKGHSVTRMTGAVKNLFGTVSRDSRRRLHARGLHRGIAAIGRYFQAKTLHVADARRRLTRAVFSEAEPLGYVLSGVEPFALDNLGCKLLGIPSESVAHIAPQLKYEVRGQQPSTPEGATLRDSLSARLRRSLYAAAYALDHAKSVGLGGRSLLPTLHWYLGVHPDLAPDLSRAELELVAESCPVGAIDVENKLIRQEVCQSVRCLACHQAHPELIRLAGLNPPSRPGRKDGKGSHA